MWLGILQLFAAFLIIVYVYYKWSVNAVKKRGIHCLDPKFPYGTSFDFFLRRKQMGLIWANSYNILKSQGLKVGAFFSFHKPIILTCDPELVRTILTKDFQHFTDHTLVINEKKDPLNGHLFNLQGTKWRNMRMKLTPTFTSGKMKQMYPLLVECSRLLMESMKGVSGGNKEGVEMKELFANFTTDVIGSCAFGLDCKSFEGESDFRRYGRKFFAPTLLHSIYSVVIFAFPLLADALGLKLIEDDVEKFFIGTVKQTIDYRKKNDVARKDFMQLIMDVQEKEGLTLEEVAAQCFVFFVAGFETSSTLVNFCLYELAKNQDVQEKLRQDIKETLKKHSGEFSYEAIHDMKYLGCVLEETLRKHPPVNFLGRRCNKDWTDEETGLTIKDGEGIVVPTYGMQHDPEFFPEPEKFIPERFNEENKGNIVPYTFLPFGEGPRLCIGLRFGLMQSRAGIAMMLDKYRFKLNKKTVEPFQINPYSVVSSTVDPIYFDVEEL